METTPSKAPRIAVMGGIAVLAIAAIVYFSFFYPPTKNEDAAGTIGAAKKYQSEQITDKDVKLADASAEAPATSSGSIVDEKTAKEFAATAATFEKTFGDFNSRYNIGSKFVAESKATIGALATMSAKAGRADFGRASGGDTPMESMSARPSFDKAAASDLYSQAAALAKSATEIMSKNAPTLDKQTMMDMRSQMSQISNKASSMEKAMTINLESRESLENRSLENKKLENRGLEKQSLEKQSLEKQSLEKSNLEKQSLEKQSLEKQKLEKQSMDKQQMEKQALENKPQQ